MRSDIRNLGLASFIFLICACVGCGVGSNTAPANATPEPATTSPISTPPPMDSRPKVVAFGDSFTAGAGIDDWRKNYPSRLQEEMDKAGFGLQVVNRGRSGDTSTQGLGRIDEALGAGEIRIFIVAFGGNDVVRGVDLNETKSSLAEIIKRAKEKGAKVLLCGYDPPGDPGRARSMREMYAALARENDVTLLPSLLAGVQQDPKLLLPDGVHPNEQGAKVIEQSVWKALQPLLSGEKKR
jgi:acyl-CoA thioesterase-1